MQRTSAGLGRHRFASDDRFQPALLCGLFAAPSGFKNQPLCFQTTSCLLRPSRCALLLVRVLRFTQVTCPLTSLEGTVLSGNMCGNMRKSRSEAARSCGLSRTCVSMFPQFRSSCSLIGRTLTRLRSPVRRRGFRLIRGFKGYSTRMAIGLFSIKRVGW